MTKKYRYILTLVLPLLVVLLLFLFAQGTNFAVLNPKGSIAGQQRDLIVIATLLMLIVVIPVFVLTFLIAWKYREGNKRADYRPDEDGNRTLEITWWTIPLALVIVLAGLIWRSSHTLDPFQPIAHAQKPITVQVVSLEWKWLFIYPEQGIATVNYLQIPEDTPINFELTSDAPMNSFWIPQLGGQVYTMAGMQTKLHLIADEQGEYTGQSANLSGEGFAGMKFPTKATSQADFDNWVQSTKQTAAELSQQEYETLAKPSSNNSASLYTYKDKRVYNNIIASYTTPADGETGGHHGQ